MRRFDAMVALESPHEVLGLFSTATIREVRHLRAMPVMRVVSTRLGVRIRPRIRASLPRGLSAIRAVSVQTNGTFNVSPDSGLKVSWIDLSHRFSLQSDI